MHSGNWSKINLQQLALLLFSQKKNVTLSNQQKIPEQHMNIHYFHRIYTHIYIYIEKWASLLWSYISPERITQTKKKKRILALRCIASRVFFLCLLLRYISTHECYIILYVILVHIRFIHSYDEPHTTITTTTNNIYSKKW